MKTPCFTTQSAAPRLRRGAAAVSAPARARLKWIAGACVLAGAFAAPLSSAQSPAEPPPRAIVEDVDSSLDSVLRVEIENEELRAAVGAAINDLGDPDWSTRRDASERLRRLRIDTEMLKRLIRYAPLSAEQRNHLIVITADRIISAPAGAIGIRMQIDYPNGVRIDTVLPGLPAEKALRPGDVITHFNGAPVRNSAHFGDLMTGFMEGDTIHLRIARPAKADGALRGPLDLVNLQDAEILEVDLTLVSARELGAEHHDNLMARRLMEVRTLIETAPANEIEVRSPAYEPAVDEHSAILELRREIEMLGELNADDRRLLVSHWQRQYEELRRWYIEPGISAQERQYRRDVLNRYVELLPRDVFGDL